MTDQPQQAPSLPEQEAPAPRQQGPPAAKQYGDQMRFMVRLQDHPGLPNYNQPAGLFRFQVTEEKIVTDRFDRDRKMWLDWPNMVAFTGIGGTDDYIEVGETEANGLIEKWLADAPAPDAQAEPGMATGTASAQDRAASETAVRGFELSGSLRRLMPQPEKDEEAK